MARTNLTTLKRQAAPQTEAYDVKATMDEQIKQRQAYAKAGEQSDWFSTGLAGAGAGWVFGPVGALIGAGVTALVNKKRNAGILAQATADSKTSAALLDEADRNVSRLEAMAVDPEDKMQAANLRTQYDNAAILAAHPSAEIASKGFELLLNLPGLISEQGDAIEKEQIAAEESKRQQLTDEMTRADGIRDDVFKDTLGQQFRIREDAYARMLAVDDSAAGDQVLLVNAFKMVDPNSAVLPGEAATAANTAGVPEFLVTAYNRLLRGGERLDPPQRADLIRQAGLQYGVARADQVDRNTSAIERGRAQNIRDELLQQVTIPIKGQDKLPFPTARRSVAGESAIAGPASEAPTVAPADGKIGSFNRTLLMQTGTDVRNLRVLPESVQKMVDNLPRDARVIPDRATGNLVISVTGRPSSEMELDQASRNAILGTLPSDDELRNLAPETGADMMLRRTKTNSISRPTND